MLTLPRLTATALLRCALLMTACSADFKVCGPCGGSLSVDAVGLVRPADHATGLKICLTVQNNRSCMFRSISALRADRGQVLLGVASGTVVHDFVLAVLRHGAVVRSARLSRVKTPRLKRDLSDCSCPVTVIRYNAANCGLQAAA